MWKWRRVHQMKLACREWSKNIVSTSADEGVATAKNASSTLRANRFSIRTGSSYNFNNIKKKIFFEKLIFFIFYSKRWRSKQQTKKSDDQCYTFLGKTEVKRYCSGCVVLLKTWSGVNSRRSAFCRTGYKYKL